METHSYDGDTESLSYHSEQEVKNHKKKKDKDEIIELPHCEEKFPDEKLKTVLALFLLFTGFFFTVTSLCVTHEKLPDRRKYEPLPDVVLDNLPEKSWALNLSEYTIIFFVNSVIFLLMLHDYRFIILRRICLMLFVLYLYRALTMFVTVLPIANKWYYCADKAPNTSTFDLVKRIFIVMSGFGLSLTGKHIYCGDYIYSGHTVTLTMVALIMGQYSPEKWWWLHWFYWIFACIGIALLELSHGHYTIDVIIAYFVTTRLFWIYHAMADNEKLKDYNDGNYFCKVWWFWLFYYFEKNVKGTVPNEYGWPFPIPKKFVK